MTKAMIHPGRMPATSPSVEMDFVGRMGRLNPDYDDEIRLLLVQQLGIVTSRGFARERSQAFNKIVSKIYSPPRVAAEIKRGKFEHLPRIGIRFDCD